jgi:replicative DNA helicase
VARKSERVLPHSLEAEKAVLGALLLYAEAMDVATEVVQPAEFFRDAHRRVFEAAIRVHERGSAVDMLTVKDELASRGELDEVGGPSYLMSLADGIPRASNVAHYARIVREKAARRGVIHAAMRMLDSAYAEEDAGAAMEEAESHLSRLHGGSREQTLRPMRELMQEFLPALERAHAHQGMVSGTPWGLADVDVVTRGLHPRQMVILAGRPGEGKSTLALQVAWHASQGEGHHVALFTLEASVEETSFRVVSGQARIDGHRLQTGHIGSSDWTRISTAIGMAADCGLWVDDSSTHTVRTIRAAARRLHARHPLRLIVVDYLQLLSSPPGTRGESRALEVGNFGRGLLQLARELGVPVLAVSQMSRAQEEQNRRPKLSDLRESGSLEQDAHVVAFIYNPPGQQTDVPTELIFAKNRNGPRATVQLTHVANIFRFEQLAQGGHP